MVEKSENKYVRRTQNDYSMSFKLQVVEEIEKGYLNPTGVHVGELRRQTSYNEEVSQE